MISVSTSMLTTLILYNDCKIPYSVCLQLLMRLCAWVSEDVDAIEVLYIIGSILYDHRICYWAFYDKVKKKFGGAFAPIRLPKN